MEQRITLQAHRASPGQILHTYTGAYAIAELFSGSEGTVITLDNGIVIVCNPEEYVTVNVFIDYGVRA
jgi:hypothetical protein